ncbi:hypothetical protein [Halomarina litorea]|uniref:hypothetical protein n=1 Tax=Halomarina litorea TaxID=2961595 RepID=UPI0020C41BBF|nr:hypothetical protein [Halomarina sp. BCD28]
MGDFDFSIVGGTDAFAVQNGAFTGLIVLEEFNDPIGGVENYDGSQGPWRGSASVIGTTSDSFSGPSAAYRENYDNRSRKWSYPGDGLDAYPTLGSATSEGSTISMAVRPRDNYVRLSFCHAPGHETDGYGCYWVTFDIDTYYDDLLVQRADEAGVTKTIGSTEVSIADGDWFIVAVTIDENGVGGHVVRLYRVDMSGGAGNGVRADLVDTLEVNDTTHRGRGIGFVHFGTGSWDALTLGLL